ncbi:MAG: phosphatidylglycerol lysyltransferase domain-containing protein [Dissulfuribacterales bacterium]
MNDDTPVSLDAVPVFPDCEPIGLKHREMFASYAAIFPAVCSEYTFTNLFAWAKTYDYCLSRLNDALIVRRETGGVLSFLQPLWTADPLSAILTCREFLKEFRQPTSLFLVAGRVCENVAAIIMQDVKAAGLQIHSNRDDFDYLYEIEALVELSGRRYHRKKHHLNAFIKAHDYEYISLGPQTSLEFLRECQFFVDRWCNEKECEKDLSLSSEECAVSRMLAFFHVLGLKGGVIRMNGEIVALTLAEALNSNTLVIHVEKAVSGVSGLYQAINWEFLCRDGGGYRYVNREQDLGVDGLRQAKLSYYPVRLIEKYDIFSQ